MPRRSGFVGTRRIWKFEASLEVMLVMFRSLSLGLTVGRHVKVRRSKGFEGS